jgi:hypothetical protein
MDVNVSDKLMVSIVLKFWKNDVGTIVCAVEFSVTVLSNTHDLLVVRSVENVKVFSYDFFFLRALLQF